LAGKFNRTANKRIFVLFLESMLEGVEVMKRLVIITAGKTHSGKIEKLCLNKLAGGFFES
jgi:hypothetical protein